MNSNIFVLKASPPKESFLFGDHAYVSPCHCIPILIDRHRNAFKDDLLPDAKFRNQTLEASSSGTATIM